MTRSTIFFGIVCFIVGIALGYLIAYTTTPQTPEQQRAAAQLMMAQAKVEEARAEKLKLESRVSEMMLPDLANVQKFSSWVNALLIPTACLLIIIAIAIWFWRGWKNDNAPAVESASLGVAAINQFQKSFANEEPVAHKNVIYARSPATSEKVKRDLADVREFLERGAVIGFSRETWIGNAVKGKARYHFKSGHDCDRERHTMLVEMCTRANVFDKSDGTPKLTCSLAEALDAFSDGEPDRED